MVQLQARLEYRLLAFQIWRHVSHCVHVFITQTLIKISCQSSDRSVIQCGLAAMAISEAAFPSRIVVLAYASAVWWQFIKNFSPAIKSIGTISILKWKVTFGSCADFVCNAHTSIGPGQSISMQTAFEPYIVLPSVQIALTLENIKSNKMIPPKTGW